MWHFQEKEIDKSNNVPARGTECAGKLVRSTCPLPSRRSFITETDPSEVPINSIDPVASLNKHHTYTQQTVLS